MSDGFHIGAQAVTSTRASHRDADMATDARLEPILRTAALPLLEEHDDGEALDIGAVRPAGPCAAATARGDPDVLHARLPEG